MLKKKTFYKRAGALTYGNLEDLVYSLDGLFVDGETHAAIVLTSG